MNEYRWLLYALISALAASLVAIFGKIGMKGIDSTLATTVRSVVMTGYLLVLSMLLGVGQNLRTLHSKAFLMIVLSGVAGATSWLFYFKAIQVGEIAKVAPIDKLSMPLGILLAVLIFSERPSAINWLGIALVGVGACLAAIPARP